MARVFLADCQPLFNEALEALITRDGTNEVVGQASAVPQIVASVPQLKPDLFVLDAGLALSSRPTLVETILAELPDTKVILLAQDTDIDLLLHAIRAGAVGVVGKKSGTQTVLRAVQAVLDGEGVVPRAMLPQLFRRLLDMGDRATDAPLNRRSPRVRGQVLMLLLVRVHMSVAGRAGSLQGTTSVRGLEPILEPVAGPVDVDQGNADAYRWTVGPAQPVGARVGQCWVARRAGCEGGSRPAGW
jgi:DNA-binding NarL/FixJ family response regulator